MPGRLRRRRHWCRGSGNTALVPDHVWQAADALYMRFATPVPIDDIFVEGIEGAAFKQPHQMGRMLSLPSNQCQCLIPGAA